MVYYVFLSSLELQIVGFFGYGENPKKSIFCFFYRDHG